MFSRFKGAEKKSLKQSRVCMYMYVAYIHTYMVFLLLLLYVVIYSGVSS